MPSKRPRQRHLFSDYISIAQTSRLCRDQVNIHPAFQQGPTPELSCGTRLDLVISTPIGKFANRIGETRPTGRVSPQPLRSCGESGRAAEILAAFRNRKVGGPVFRLFGLASGNSCRAGFIPRPDAAAKGLDLFNKCIMR